MSQLRGVAVGSSVPPTTVGARYPPAPVGSRSPPLARAGCAAQPRAAHAVRQQAAPPVDFDLPELEEDLRSAQAAAGAIFEVRLSCSRHHLASQPPTTGSSHSHSQAGSEAPASFRNAQAVAHAQEQGAALADFTHWGRLRITGRDALQFLHQQSTADFTSLQPGQGCRAVRPPTACLIPAVIHNTPEACAWLVAEHATA